MSLKKLKRFGACEIPKRKKFSASSGNRTRAARVAGEHSTTEPTMLKQQLSKNCMTKLG